MKKILLIAVAIIALTACSRKTIPVTSSLRKTLGEKQMASLQFYTSEKIVLKKSSSNGSVHTDNGEVMVNGYDESETVVIPKGTPGVMVKSDSGLVAIRFENGIDKYLPFGDNGGIYSLMAKNWQNRQGNLKYAGKEYTAVGLSGMSCIVVKSREVKRSQRLTRKVTGVRIN